MRFIFSIVLFFFFIQTRAANDSTDKKVRILPFPNLGYSPETRWYAGAVGLFTVKFYQDTLTRKSNFKAEVVLSQNKQLIATLKHESYLLRNSYVFSGTNAIYYYPEYFWGIGNSTDDEAKELYSAHRMEIDNTFYRQLIPNIFAGFRYRLQSIYNINSEDGGLLASGSIVGADGGISSGVGYSISYDSRDNVLNPKRGAFVSFSNLFYGGYASSNYTFQSYETDFRKYFPLHRNHTLALQLTTTFLSGNIPFRMLALTGGENTMRGYYTGRYRDKNMFSTQAEYRVHIWKAIGAAIFAGGGDVSRRFNGFDSFKPSIGAGVRIRVDKEDDVNLRFDYAIGDNSEGFYVVYAEAF